MKALLSRSSALFCAFAFATHVLGAVLTVSPDRESVLLGGTKAFTAKLDGTATTAVRWFVNGAAGGDSANGTISANGVYTTPPVAPQDRYVAITAVSSVDPAVQGIASVIVRFPIPTVTAVTPASLAPGPYTLAVTGDRFYPGAVVWVSGLPVTTTYLSRQQFTATGTMLTPGIYLVQVVNPGNEPSDWSKWITISEASPPPSPNSGAIAAARLLEQATFGPTANDMAAVQQMGASAWLTQQLALPASPLPVAPDLNLLRKSWYMNMASASDQVRQRVIFALSQIFVVSADKNPYGNEMLPWLHTLSKHALGSFDALLREMTLNPSMAKYLDLGNSVIPSPNENYAREMMQLFTIGLSMLNQDGTLQLDAGGNPIPTYDQARIHDMARALSGWTYPGSSATGTNWENFTGPLQPRDNYHDKGAKTLLLGMTLPANQTAQQDYDAVMQNIFNHPNVPPFIATRLVRALVKSNPSPAYVKRVADVFTNNGGGLRGDLAATVRAVLLDPEARDDTPSSTQGHLKDPVLHSLSLIRTMGGTVIDPSNLFWDYFLLGERLLNSPSVFNFYSPTTRVPGAAQYYGPEFQIYAPSLAIGRANFLYALLSGNYKSMIDIDITPFIAVAPNVTALIDKVDNTLLQGRMSNASRQAIGSALQASTDNRERAITALYLTAISAEYAVQK